MGVLEAKSITKAAEHLYVAQPALGLQIRKLEEELGVELFVRHFGVAPTEAGLLLAQHAQVLLRQFARARQDLLDFARSPHGRVSVGLTPTVTSVLVAGLCGSLSGRVPGRRLEHLRWPERASDSMGRGGSDRSIVELQPCTGGRPKM